MRRSRHEATDVLRPRILANAIGWSFGGDLWSKGAVLLTAIIAARALSPAGFGQYLAWSAAVLLTAALADLGVTTLLTRELAAGRLTMRSGLVQTFRLRFKTAPVWIMGFGIATVLLSAKSDVSLPVIAIFGAASLLTSANMVVLAGLRGALQFRAAAGSVAAGRWVSALASLAALSVSDGHELAFLALALVAGEAFLLMLATVALARTSNPARVQRHDTEDTFGLRHSLPFAANSILNLAYNRLDVVILGVLASTQQLSHYAPASRAQDALLLIPAAIGVVAFPLIAQVADSADGARKTAVLVRQLVVSGVVVSTAVATVVCIYAPEILGVVLGEQYDGATTATRILVWFLPLAAIQAPLLAAMAASGYAADTTKVFACAFATAVTMHLSLDWWAGATGAAIASLSREPVAVLVAVLMARRVGILDGLLPRAPRRSRLAGVVR